MKPRNLKLKLIILFSVLATISIVLLLLFLFTDIFRTKRGAFFRYFPMTSNAIEILKSDDFEGYDKAKEQTPYIRNANVIIKSSSNIADSSIMDKIKLTMTTKVDNKDEKAEADISIKSNSSELATISGIKEKESYAFYSPLIVNGYIGIRNENLNELANSVGINDIYVPESIIKIKKDKVFDITKVEKSHIESYYNLLKTSTSDTSYSKKKNDKVKSEGKTYSTVAYTLKLEGKESADVQSTMLNKLSQDSIMMDFLTSKFKLLNLDSNYTDINTLNSRMQAKIKELSQNPENATPITITVNEYKQKNIQATIIYGDTKIVVFHLKENNTETSIFSVNDKSFKISKTDNEYTIKYSYTEDEINKSIEIRYHQEGSIEENNIKNKMDITHTNGIKVVTFAYEDSVNFTNDIGSIKKLSNERVALLNDYSKEEVSEFVSNIEKRINEVYVNKGASIGINLDPIFVD